MNPKHCISVSWQMLMVILVVPKGARQREARKEQILMMEVEKRKELKQQREKKVQKEELMMMMVMVKSDVLMGKWEWKLGKWMRGAKEMWAHSASCVWVEVVVHRR